MKKENEKLEARVEALEKRVRTLEAMFNSPAAYAPPCAHNSSPETQWTLPLGQGEYPKGEGVDNTRQVVHADGLNEKAWELMEKARKGGLLDEEYMPTGSRTEAALLAGAIAQDSGMEKKWTPFEKLWKINGLRFYADKATYLTKFPTIIKQINSVLNTKCYR